MNKNKKLLISIILILLLLTSCILYFKFSPCKIIHDARHSGNPEIGTCQIFACYKNIITRECMMGCIKRPSILWMDWTDCIDDYSD